MVKPNRPSPCFDVFLSIKHTNKPKTNLMNLLSVSDPSDFVSIEVNAEESVLRAQDHPVPVDEAG